MNARCFVLMPTGGWKPLCFQLPVLLRDGFTIVTSKRVIEQRRELHELPRTAQGLETVLNYLRRIREIRVWSSHFEVSECKLLSCQDLLTDPYSFLQ